MRDCRSFDDHSSVLTESSAPELELLMVLRVGLTYYSYAVFSRSQRHSASELPSSSWRLLVHSSKFTSGFERRVGTPESLSTSQTAEVKRRKANRATTLSAPHPILSMTCTAMILSIRCAANGP